MPDAPVPAGPDRPENRAPEAGQRQPAPPRWIDRSRVWAALRFLLATALMLASQAAIAAAIWLAAGSGAGTSPAFVALAELVPLLVLLAAWHFITQEPLFSLGVKGPARRVARGLGAGSAAGVAIMACVVGAGILFDAWTVWPAAAVNIPAVAAWTLVLAIAAFFEEVWFRGHALQELGRGSPAFGAIASSLLFALIHLNNPGVHDGRALPLLLLIGNITFAGILMAAAFLHSGDLWLPTGLHWGWNWAQALLFGLPVSGMDLPSLLDGNMAAEPRAWAGSSFGPESSLPAFVLVAGLGTAWLVVVLRRGAQAPADAWAAERAAIPAADPGRTDGQPG